jgi:hypothetical protein
MSNINEVLNSSLGKSIDRICPNKFHDFSSNHCAHYVSHMMGLEFSYNCKEFKGGNKQAGNIRVHEIFSQCPKVGKFNDKPDTDQPLLVFVTRKDVVNLSEKRMVNIPQKHIGVFLDNHIYHYSNSQEKVVKWTPQEFYDRFEHIYRGKQGLFYGTVPGSDLELKIDSNGTNVSQGIAFKLRKNNNQWFATPLDSTNKEFYIGRETKQSNPKYFGVFRHTFEYTGYKYKPEEYIETLDHWSYLLYLTGYCESKNYFNVFNTYDRAKFTFGFYQLAAHTPDDNLILFFRRLTELEKFKDYFPELTMQNGKLTRVNQDGAVTNLETVMRTGRNNAKQLQLFMNYLNPIRKLIDEQEILQVARLMHWTEHDPEIRKLQVEVSNEILQHKMAIKYHKWYDLNGQSDLICALIADIHHQGRASKSRVKKALASDDPIEALITINPNYTGRISDLRDITKELLNNGKLGHKRYDAANNEFIEI